MILPPPLGAAVVQLQQLVRPEPQQRRAVRPRTLPPRSLRGRARDGGRGRGGAGELPVAGGDLFPVCGAACSIEVSVGIRNISQCQVGL